MHTCVCVSLCLNVTNTIAIGHPSSANDLIFNMNNEKQEQCNAHSENDGYIDNNKLIGKVTVDCDTYY